MPALVTLEHAKQHLGITTIDRDTDLQIKCEQASAIILDYLKGRAHEGPTTAVIETSSEASPTVITTVSPHGFTDGATVFVSGHRTSVPAINGGWVISAAAGSSFTIPVEVTTAGAGGRVSVTWTELTVPLQVQAAVLVMLTHLVEHRGDDMTSDELVWKSIERLCIRNRDMALA